MPFSEWSHLFTSKGRGGGVVGCADPAARSRILERMFDTARELDWLGKLNEQQREAATAPSAAARTELELGAYASEGSQP